MLLKHRKGVYTKSERKDFLNKSPPVLVRREYVTMDGGKPSGGWNMSISLRVDDGRLETQSLWYAVRRAVVRDVRAVAWDVVGVEAWRLAK